MNGKRAKRVNMSVTLITSKSVSGEALEITGLFEKKAQFLQFPLIDLLAHHPH